MEMDMEQAKAAYQSLSEQERELIREAMDSPLAGVLAKIFPDLIGALGSFNKPRRQMDAAQRQMAAGMLMG
jgi:transcriptional regulator with AAA-type ATPase domain